MEVVRRFEIGFVWHLWLSGVERCGELVEGSLPSGDGEKFW